MDIKRTLIAYFSHSGNTAIIAEMLRSVTESVIFEIKAVKTYPEDYEAVVKEAKHELRSGATPELRAKAVDMGKYDAVFLGYPNWWGTFPAPVKTFLTEHDLAGKTIIPFCTHEGSAMGRSIADISQLCPQSTVLNGLAIWGSQVKNGQSIVTQWLGKLRNI